MTLHHSDVGQDETAASDDAPARKKLEPLLTIGQVAAVGLTVAAVIQVVIRTAGWVTPVSNSVTLVSAALSTAVATAHARSSLFRRLAPPWLWYAAVVAVAVGVGLSWIYRGDTRLFSGELTATDPAWEHVLRVDTGDRVVVALDTMGGLDAELRVDRGRWRHDGSGSEDSTTVVDQTLHGGQWRIRVAANDDTVGHFEVRVEKNPGRNIAIGDAFEQEALTDIADTNGYRFLVERRQAVYIVVDPDGDLDVQLDLRRDGWAVANPRLVDGSWVIHRTLEPDEYMLVVRSPSGRRGDYSFEVLDQAPVATPSETTLPAIVLRDVPDGLVGATEEEVVQELSDRGFALAVWDVCSSSVPAGMVRQVIREDPEAGEVVVADLGGTVSEEKLLPADTQLVLKVGTGDACGDE